MKTGKELKLTNFKNYNVAFGCVNNKQPKAIYINISSWGDPQYDECLREFIDSGHDYWEVDMASLPSQKPRVVLSSLKWRIENKAEFKGIQAIMQKNKIYLTRVKQ